MTIGEIIKCNRKGRMTQKQLAEKIGVTSITIQNYENGRSEPNFETINKIASALGLTLVDFFNMTGESVTDNSLHLPMTERLVEELLKRNVNIDELDEATKVLIIDAVKLDLQILMR